MIIRNSNYWGLTVRAHCPDRATDHREGWSVAEPQYPNTPFRKWIIENRPRDS